MTSIYILSNRYFIMLIDIYHTSEERIQSLINIGVRSRGLGGLQPPIIIKNGHYRANTKQGARGAAAPYNY